MLLFYFFFFGECKNEEYEIFNHVFENYNPEVRPSDGDGVIKVIVLINFLGMKFLLKKKVEIALTMQQMINLDEKRETVTISAFPEVV